LSKEPITYVTDEDSIAIKETILNQGGWVMGGKVPVFDKVAPIIVYKNLKYEGETYRSPFVIDFQIADSTDTLFVAFSEKITFDDDAKEPFYFLDTPQNKNYSVTIREGEYEFIDEKTMKFALDQVNSDAGGIRAGDSIWIHEKDWIGDICESDDGGTENNYQNNPDNRRREVNVVFKAVVIGLDPVTISPLDLGSITNNSSINIIPDDIIELFDLENKLQDLQLQTIVDDEGNTVFIGMLIQIIPDETDLETLKDLFLEGELFIFDAVGNEVISAKPMVFNKKNKTLNYVWNGRNFNNRFVGAGAYLALGECVKWPLGKDSGKPHEKVTKRFMLAVKE